MSDIRIASLNVNGARDRIKRTVIYETMNHKKIDIFLLQETHSDVTNAFEWEKEFKGLPFLSHKSHLVEGLLFYLLIVLPPVPLRRKRL